MGTTRTTSRQRASAPAEEIDLQAIDAFLEKGAEAVDGPEVDPISSLKAPPPLSRPKEAPSAPDSRPKPRGGQTAETPPPKDRPPIPEGAIRISVAEDKMRAQLTVEPSRHLSFDDVIQALGQANVRDGVDEDAILELLDSIPETSEAERSIQVAEGTPPLSGKPAEVMVPALQEAALSAEGLAVLQTAGHRLGELLASGKAEGADEACTGLPIVRPGEVAVRISPAVPGSVGIDVRGREVPVEPVDEQVPAPGEGVEVSDDGQTYLAKSYGYLRIDGQEVSVLSPVWVAPDEMAVYVLDLMPPNGPLDPGALIAQMRELGIASLPEVEGLAGQLRKTEGQVQAVAVGTGIAPEAGQDAQVEMAVEAGSRIGTVLEDGSIDFKERNFAASVEPDTLLAVKRPATSGKPGLTVRGREISVEPGKDLPLEAGSNVEAVEGEGEIRFYSRAEGCVYNPSGTLEVRLELRISGDVDYSTGNIDFKGDVTIAGIVRGGFSVKATGDVTVGGGLEDGALVSAGRSVAVSKGVFGEKSRVAALEGIRAQFVQDASLLCRGNVEVGSYIYNATVRGDTVTVHGRGEKGGIVGGEVGAKTGIVAASVGSEYGTATRLVAGLDVELIRSLQKVEQGLSFCRMNMQKLMSALKVTSADPKAIGQAMMHLPSSQRKRIRLLARKLEELAQMEKRLDEEQVDLEQQQQTLAHGAQIRVAGSLFHKVDLFIGKVHRRITDPLKAVAFRLSKDGRIEAFTPKQEAA